MIVTKQKSPNNATVAQKTSWLTCFIFTLKKTLNIYLSIITITKNFLFLELSGSWRFLRKCILFYTLCFAAFAMEKNAIYTWWWWKVIHQLRFYNNMIPQLLFNPAKTLILTCMYDSFIQVLASNFFFSYITVYGLSLYIY